MSASPDDLPIEALDLSVRAYNCLRRAKKDTVGQLLVMSDEELLAIRNLGRNALAEIREKLVVCLGNRPELPQLTSAQDKVHPTPQLQQKEKPEVPRCSAMQAPVAVLNLSAQSHDALKWAGCQNVGDVAALGDEGLCWILGSRNQRVIAEIKEQLNALFSKNPKLPRPIPLEVLNLSIRPRNALMRHDVFTVDKLAQMSEEAIWEIPNIGTKSVAEITERLSAFLQVHPLPTQFKLSIEEVEIPPPPPPPLSLADPGLLAVAQEQGIPLGRVALERLALSELDHALLHKAGIETIGELAYQARDKWNWQGSIVQHLNQYLSWLIEQDEVAWKNETTNQGISPLQRLALTATTLEQMTNKWLRCLSNREEEILRRRYGLNGEAVTLEEIGDNLGITRERVRQIQNKAIRKLRLPQHYSVVCPLSSLLMHLLRQAGGMLNPQQFDTALRSELVIEDVNPVGLVRLTLDLSDNVEWVREAESWGLTCMPLDKVPTIYKRLVAVLEQAYMPLPVEAVISQLKATRYYHNHRDKLEDAFVVACLKTHPQIEIDENGLCGLKKWNSRRLDEVVLALRQIGKPAHYSIIAEQANSLLTPDQQTSVRNIQALLDRQTAVFICLGRGKYWLRSHVFTDADAQPEADFGDLFGMQLAHWQEELDRREGNSEFDTHAEVDRIRNAGLDFFAD